MVKSKVAPVIFIALVTCLIFFKIFTKGLYPIPGDLLVSFYFPWFSGDWQGYNSWTTHKEMLGADSIRQIYLWKEFAANELKRGNLPLWNPYTFSGQPLAANFQSSVYYPLNVFYLLTSPANAWILLIVLQPFLGGIFMYMLIRSLKKEVAASLFASAAFMFSSYLITWMENGNVSHSYIWLPLAFWAIVKYFGKPKFRYLIILTASFALSILGGHPQTAIYVYMAAFLFWVYKTWEKGKGHVKKLVTFALWALISLFISAIQLVPTYYFYKVSPISLPFSREIFDRAIFPYQNLVTFFASDFFGHPANNNFWSQTYGDFTPYFGVIPLVFSLWAVFRLWRNRFVKFLTLTSIFFIFSAVPGPITAFIKFAQIPLISATTPARFISISIFLMIILCAFGLEDFLKNIRNIKYQKGFLKFQVPILLLYLFLWIFAIFGTNFLNPKEIWQTNLAVTRRNLILPSAMFFSVFGLSFALVYSSLAMRIGYTISIAGIFAATLLGGVYFTNKFMPASPKTFIFPDHLLFNWLKENADINRFYGRSAAHIDFNFPTHYKVYAVEGYDTLRLERYAQLLASSFSGKVPQTYLRSDAIVPSEENGYRKRVFELLGVKYIIDKDDNPKTGADWHTDTQDLVWSYHKFQSYERKPVLPRIFQTTSYFVARDDKEIIEKIYDPAYDLKRIILEKNPPINISQVDQDIVIPKIDKYDTSQVVVSTDVNYNSLLFLSDAYDKDWNVYIDSTEGELLRADYALRAVAVPSGSHQVVFKYEPKSSVLGTFGTISTIATLTAVSIYFKLKRKL